MKRLFGFLAMAGLMLFAAPVERAQAVSLINPAASAQTKYLSDNMAVEVRHGGGRGGFRGGGGSFHGGFRGGGHHFGGARFVGRPAYVGRPAFVGRRHFVGQPYFAPRHRFVHHRPFVVRRHAWRRPYIYPYYYAEPRLFCRRVWTDFGPRRICRYRPWWV